MNSNGQMPRQAQQPDLARRFELRSRVSYFVSSSIQLRFDLLELALIPAL
jgi:hypothetical protein